MARRTRLARSEAGFSILFIRGERVLLDGELARLYGVPTKVLLQAVRRNLARFPADFRFQLDLVEAANLRSQFVTSSWGGRRNRPWAFTEHGVAMLASVLRSERAVAMSIEIIRAFVRMRRMLVNDEVLARRIAALERASAEHGARIRVVFEALRAMTATAAPARKRVGFRQTDRAGRPSARSARRAGTWLPLTASRTRTPAADR